MGRCRLQLGYSKSFRPAYDISVHESVAACDYLGECNKSGHLAATAVRPGRLGAGCYRMGIIYFQMGRHRRVRAADLEYAPIKKSIPRFYRDHRDWIIRLAVAISTNVKCNDLDNAKADEVAEAREFLNRIEVQIP